MSFYLTAINPGQKSAKTTKKHDALSKTSNISNDQGKADDKTNQSVN